MFRAMRSTPRSPCALAIAAAKRNADDDIGQNMRVHGLLTDLSDFRFYSYDPVDRRFAIDGHFMVGGDRRARLRSMVPGEYPVQSNSSGQLILG
jgi:hypothetical protein